MAFSVRVRKETARIRRALPATNKDILFQLVLIALWVANIAEWGKAAATSGVANSAGGGLIVALLSLFGLAAIASGRFTPVLRGG